MRKGLFSSSKPSSPAHYSTTNSSTSSPARVRHTFSDQLMEENIDNAEAVIARWEIADIGSLSTDSNRSSSMFREYPEEAKRLLRAVQDLQSSMHYLIKHDASSESLVRAQNLMELAMRRLEKEFHSILSRNRTILGPESVSSRSSRASARTSSASASSDGGDEVSIETDEEEDYRYYNETEIMEDLKSIAECMIASGYGKECVSIYKLVRKSIVDESLYNLGVLENLNSSQIQKLEWEFLESRIRNWLSGVKIAMKSIFLGERILCDYVFSSSEKIIESCFVEIARERALLLLSFPEMVAKSKRLSAEKMFRVLDLYEAISALWPEIEVIFAFDSFSAVRSQAVTSLVKLGDAVRSMLSEFESAIQKDTSKAVPGGGIHPLTRYVMNYLAFLADYSDSLADIVADWPLPLNFPLPEAYLSTLGSPSAVDGVADGGEDSPLSVRLAWLILVLLCKLDAKAELYKDVALAYLFLANNLNYIVSKIRKSNLGPILGSEWVFKHEAKVKQYISNYERMGWSKVLTSFPGNPTADMSLDFVKECFRRFNSGFQEAYRTQSSWVIPDLKLREQAKLSLARKIVPMYREFYESYRGTLRQDFGVLEPIVRFAPDDLGNYLSDLFDGIGGVSSGSTTTMTNTTSYESPSHTSKMSTSRGH